MAKNTLPVNFQDDIINSSMDGKRRYKVINNSDGTISLEDATTYDQVGSNFGAGQMNATNTAVNAAADAGKIIDDMDAIRNVTQEGYIAGALALKQVDNNLNNVETYKYTEGVEIERYGKLRVIRVLDPKVSSVQLKENDYVPNRMVAGLRIVSGVVNGFLLINLCGELQNLNTDNCLGTIIYLVE